MSSDDSPPSAAGPDDDAVDPPAALPSGPPWSVELIADLHAGRYPADVAGQLRQRMAADPFAAAVLTALDATVDQLSLLPAPRMPERFAMRLDAAIAGEHRAAAAARAPAGSANADVPGAGTDRSVPLPRHARDQSFAPVHSRPTNLGSHHPDPAHLGDHQGGRRQFGKPEIPGRQSGPQSRQAPPAGPPMGLIPAPPGPPAGAADPGVQHPVIGASSFAPQSPPARPAAFTTTAPAARSLDEARARRRRWLGGLAAAAAVVAIGTATVISLQHPADVASAPSTGTVPAPGPSSADPHALQLDPGRLGDALQQIEGKRPAGPLRDGPTYSSCLAANAIDPSAVIGVTSATFQGTPAAAIAVRVDAAHTKIVVVGTRCGIDGAADRLASETVTP